MPLILLKNTFKIKGMQLNYENLDPGVLTRLTSIPDDVYVREADVSRWVSAHWTAEIPHTGHQRNFSAPM